MQTTTREEQGDVREVEKHSSELRSADVSESCAHPSLHRLNPEHLAEVQTRLKAALAAPMDVTELDLSSLDLYTLPREVPSRIALTRLLLRSNCLLEFPAELACLSSLSELDLSRNRIEVLPESLGQLRSMRSLNLMNNHLRRLERSMPLEALALLTSLERLDLRYNRKLTGDDLEATLRSHLPVQCQLLLGTTAGRSTLATCPGERDASLLRSQLEPWGTPVLRRRLAEVFGVETDPDLGREGIFEKLLAAHTASGPRAWRKVRGQALPDRLAPLLEELLRELRATVFPTGAKRERQGVRAEGYIVLRSEAEALADVVASDGAEENQMQAIIAEAKDEKKAPADYSGAAGGISGVDKRGIDGTSVGGGSQTAPMVIGDRIVQPGMRTIRPTPKANSKRTWGRRRNGDKRQRNDSVWNLTRQVMAEVDPDFLKRCTAIAMTKNFIGSPHIDILNYGPFYGLSLGDFEGGGICVESTPLEVVEVDTKNRFGKIDGRWPHWVAPYTGERYSIIYYQTAGPEVPKTISWFPAVDQ